MSKLTIIRGLPGSGKTLHAQAIQETFGTMLIEPDALLVQDGEYRYTAERYVEAKKRSLEMVTTCGLAGADVIYADVLPTVREVEDVIESYCAGWAKPEIAVIDQPRISTDESFRYNEHDVRREDIERMAATWQPWPAEVTK